MTMVNNVIGVINYVIAPRPSLLNFMIADTNSDDQKKHPVTWLPDAPGTAVPDLRPLGLQLSQPEVEFMTRHGSLLPTPRAAKRLVNLYRLVRIGIPDAGLAAFTGSEAGGSYQVVQNLLAELVGSPVAAQRIFRELMAATADTDILTIFAKAPARTLSKGIFASVSARSWPGLLRPPLCGSPPASISAGARH